MYFCQPKSQKMFMEWPIFAPQKPCKKWDQESHAENCWFKHHGARRDTSLYYIWTVIQKWSVPHEAKEFLSRCFWSCSVNDWWSVGWMVCFSLHIPVGQGFWRYDTLTFTTSCCFPLIDVACLAKEIELSLPANSHSKGKFQHKRHIILKRSRF